ncbi:MFS transporter [Staphylococcus epidermidis]|uniref:Major facilitator superfamily protein n=3 Tax=Staphylococcus epidermidis TaxID=1282 RepID=Q5HKV8_STAEQ|nr:MULTISPECIES: MFS transporter [Staphylococcus]EHR88598.1 transporter, major facilitator family protein [Staphylococcus epidermidis VCU123]MDU2120673.1 MFS transporter [Staphylococcus aureus]AAW53085.1 major facilitator superfamily protein [Staphylococcus epidermidis RP62A]AXE40574.1 MFS transporter [Staphylococcus epidermidis]EGG71413.1 transporter, major facilitator family protein [Staphylococcus epidermidis VCU028]
MKKIWILTIGMFALGMDAYIVAGLIPSISKSFNKSSSAIGQGVTVFTLFFSISAPIFSTILAKSPVKKILIIAFSIFTLANIITAISMNYMLYIVSRAIAGLGAGVSSPIAISASNHLVSEKHKGKAIAFTVGGMSVGTVIGVPLGLEIANISNWRFAMLVIIVISFIALISISILMPKFKIEAPPNLKDRFQLFLNKHVLRVISVTLCAAIASLGLYTYLADIIKTNTDTKNLTHYLTAWGIGGLIGSFGIGFIIDRFKNTRFVMLIILILLALSFGLIPISINLPILGLIPFILWGAMGWATQAPQQHILLKKHPEYGGSAVALNSSINYLGSAMGSAIGGIILFNANSTNVLIYSALGITIIGILLQLLNLSLEKN